MIRLKNKTYLYEIYETILILIFLNSILEKFFFRSFIRLINCFITYNGLEMVLVTNSVKNLGQYFTPNYIAEFIVQLITHEDPNRILEPSAGTGNFIEALEKRYSNIVAIEIDSTLSSTCQTPIQYTNFFDYPVEEKFSIVIGNPPYVRWRNQPDEVRNDIIQRKFWNNRINALADILQAFIFKSIDHLIEGGELLFITPKFWLQTLHAANLREYILQSGYIDLIIDCNEKKIFSGVSSNLIIFKFIRHEMNKNQQIKVFKLLHKESITDEELDFISKSLNEMNYDSKYDNNPDVLYYEVTHPNTSKSWNLFPKEDKEFIDKLELSCKTNYRINVTSTEKNQVKEIQALLLNCVTKNQLDIYGLNMSQTEICFKDKKKFILLDPKLEKHRPLVEERYITISDIFEIGNGMVSGLDKAFWIREGLSFLSNLNSKELSLVKKVVKARYMEQYCVRKYADYIFIEEQEFQSEESFKEQCPHLYEYLKSFKKNLEKRWSPRPVPWYVWSFPRNYAIFKNFRHKFFLPCKERFDNKGFIRCVLENEQILGVQDITVLGLYPWIKESPEYLLAYLNSEILFKWLMIKGLKRGGVLQFSEHPLTSIPIRLINWNDQKEIELHDSIQKQVSLLINEKNLPVKRNYQRKINELLKILILKE